MHAFKANERRRDDWRKKSSPLQLKFVFRHSVNHVDAFHIIMNDDAMIPDIMCSDGIEFSAISAVFIFVPFSVCRRNSSSLLHIGVAMNESYTIYIPRRNNHPFVNWRIGANLLHKIFVYRVYATSWIIGSTMRVHCSTQCAVCVLRIASAKQYQSSSASTMKQRLCVCFPNFFFFKFSAGVSLTVCIASENRGIVWFFPLPRALHHTFPPLPKKKPDSKTLSFRRSCFFPFFLWHFFLLRALCAHFLNCALCTRILVHLMLARSYNVRVRTCFFCVHKIYIGSELPRNVFSHSPSLSCYPIIQ